MALGAAYKEPQSEDLDKDKNSDADYDNDDVLTVLMFAGKQC